MKSIRGIYYDLSESEYKYDFDEMTFVFSSKSYLTKFRNACFYYIKNETSKFRVKYGCNLIADYIFLISLYRKIEKRGFRVIYKNKELSENNLIFYSKIEV